jgi:uncharacterized membrane protein
MQRLLLGAVAVALTACDRPTGPASPEPRSPAAAIAAAPATCPVLGTYVVTRISPPGATESRAVAINDRGEVLVASNVGSFVWSATSGFQGVPVDSPQAINNAGVVVGWNTNVGGLERQAVLWSASGGLQLLTAPAGYGVGPRGSFAADINDDGVIAGGAWGPTPPIDDPFQVPAEVIAPIVWVAGVPQLLPINNLQNFEGLFGAIGISEQGEVVGGGCDDSRCFLLVWEDALNPSTPLQVFPPGADGGVATDINAAGRITGVILPVFFEPYSGFAWTAATGFQLLLPGDSESSAANAITDQGVVVGHVAQFDSENSSLVLRPSRWTVAGQIEKLPLLLGSSGGEALEINESGYIVGQIDGQAVLWSPDHSPAAALEDLSHRVRQLGDEGELSAARVHALEVSLLAAGDLLERGKVIPAQQILGAFARKVEALVRSGRLVSAEGQRLHDAVLCLIAQLQAQSRRPPTNAASW